MQKYQMTAPWSVAIATADPEGLNMATVAEKPIFREYPPLTEPPAHVPPELVFDVDLFNVPGMREDPHAAWKKIQDEKPPVFWTPRHGGYWMAVGPEEILAIQNDAITYSMRASLVPRNPRPFRAPPIDMDPPEHGKWRLILSPAFSPKAVGDAEGVIRQFAVELIEAFKNKGECEFVGEFTAMLPIVVFLTLMGLPLEDRHKLLPFAHVIARSSDSAAIHKARLGMMAYAEEQVSAREKEPTPDLISKIVYSEVDGKRIPHEMAVGMVSLGLSGGLDTVKNLMGFSCHSLAKRPDLQKRLRENLSLIPLAVEELVRRHGVSQTARLVTKDTELAGVLLKAGDQIQQFSHLVGNSDKVVSHPLTLDFDREQPIPHATFGNGPHRCPGSILGKREMVIWLEEWFKRIPEFRVKPGTVPQQSSASVLQMIELWLQWDPAEVR